MSPGEILSFVLGCCLGSFFNVVIYRLPRGESLLRPFSHCPSCDVPIAFYDNIPLLSYLILRGRCRNCGSRISLRYPLVEALSGVLTAMLYRAYLLSPAFIVFLIFASLLMVIAFIDLETFLIPDLLSLSGIILGFATSFANPCVDPVSSLIGIFFGGGVLYLISWTYSTLRGREGIGGGDIKLMAMIGAFTGCRGVVFTILVASLSGSLFGILEMKKSGERFATQIPFAPFLALGALSYIFWGELFFTWYLDWVG